MPSSTAPSRRSPSLLPPRGEVAVSVAGDGTLSRVRKSNRAPRRYSVAVPRLVLTILVVTISGCGDAPPPETAKPTIAPEELPVLVAETVTVSSQLWPKIIRTQGSLVADEVSVVGARVAGRVSDALVDLGDAINAGDLLISLEKSEFQLDVAQAEAQLAQTRAAVGLRDGDSVEKLDREKSPPVRQEKALWDEARARLERAQELIARNALTIADREQLEAAERVGEARYASALNNVAEKIALIRVRESELAIAQQRLLDTEIRAPFSGLVQQRHVAPGAYVKVGDPLVTLVRTNPLRFRGTMPERHASQLAMHQEVRLHLIPGREPLIVQVTRISPALDLMTRSLLFEAEVSNTDGQLQAGLFTEAEVVLSDATEAIAISSSSVAEFAGAEKVWRLEDGIAREQIVQTGARRGDQIEILNGLSPGDRILRDGSLGKVARIESTP